MQALSLRAVSGVPMASSEPDDLVEPEQQFLGLDDVDRHNTGGHRLDRMSTPRAHIEMKVPVPFDQLVSSARVTSSRTW